MRRPRRRLWSGGGRRFESVRGLADKPCKWAYVVACLDKIGTLRGYETGTFWGSRRTSGERCLVPSAACYEDALTEPVEGGEAVGASLDHLDLVDHPLGVAVGDRLVEVGEQFLAPEPDAFGEGAEGRDRCSVDGGEEASEPLLGLDAAGRPVDGAEGFL